jgi:hypothetical protein
LKLELRVGGFFGMVLNARRVARSAIVLPPHEHTF